MWYITCMIININESTIRSTTSCDRDMQCLQDVNKPLCDVDYCVMDEVFFVNCLTNKRCGYRFNFGYNLICTCPVRKEIFKRYHY